MPIRFFTEDISFALKEKKKHRNWLSQLIVDESFREGEINYVFCSDEYLYEINVTYLNHDTYTDIITFDQSDSTEEIAGDIFVSIERIKENATNEQIEFEVELRRVIAHGLLHLMGYKDKSDLEAAEMRRMEDKSINKYSQNG